LATLLQAGGDEYKDIDEIVFAAIFICNESYLSGDRLSREGKHGPHRYRSGLKVIVLQSCGSRKR
jgi:hypothetical protein